MIPTPLLFSASALFIHYERKQPVLFSLMRYAHLGMPKISMEILPHAKVRVLNQIVDLTDYKILLLASQSFLVERRFSCELIHNHIDRSFIYKFALATCVTKEDWNLLIMLWIHNPQPELAREYFFHFFVRIKEISSRSLHGCRFLSNILELI
jgi:hypothetical protein